MQKIDIFDCDQKTLVVVSIKELQALYELGVYRGYWDEPRPAEKCKCKVEGVIIE